MKSTYKKIFSLLFFFFAFDVVSGAELFVSDLRLNSQGEEVKLLQEVLNTDSHTIVSPSGAGSPGNETVFFGQKTKEAVIRFQEKYSNQILTPLGLSRGTGIVGFNTRKMLNEIKGQVSFSPVNNTSLDSMAQTQNVFVSENKYPQITSLSTGVIKDPFVTPLVITGKNFTADNQVFLSVQGLEIFDAPSFDGSTISVFLLSQVTNTLENYISSVLAQSGNTQTRESIIDVLKVQFNSVGRDGVYVPASIFVRNKNGESNKFGIKINILKE